MNTYNDSMLHHHNNAAAFMLAYHEIRLFFRAQYNSQNDVRSFILFLSFQYQIVIIISVRIFVFHVISSCGAWKPYQRLAAPDFLLPLNGFGAAVISKKCRGTFSSWQLDLHFSQSNWKQQHNAVSPFYWLWMCLRVLICPWVFVVIFYRRKQLGKQKHPQHIFMINSNVVIFGWADCDFCHLAGNY